MDVIGWVRISTVLSHLFTAIVVINVPSFCYRIIRSSRNTSNPMAALLVMIAGAKLYYHSFTVGLRCDVTLNVIQEVYR